MINDQILMKCISQTADMGRDSLTQVMDRTDDNQFRQVLRTQRDEYDKLYREAAQIQSAHGQTPKEAMPMAKMSSRMMTMMKTTMAADTTSKIAEMVIQGSTMGVTEVTKNLNDYDGSDHRLKNLAEKLVKTEQSNIEQMKKYL